MSSSRCGDSCRKRQLSDDEMIDILYGSAILGAGGGGQISEGLYYIKMIQEDLCPPTLISSELLNSADYVATPYLLGGVSGHGSSDCEPAIVSALKCVKRNLSKNLTAIIPVEIGASNVGLALYLASFSCIPIVDADPTGRSVPECTQSTFAIHSLPLGNVAAATDSGETFFIEYIQDDARAEVILRALSSVSGQDLSVIDHVLPFGEISKGLIQGSITVAQSLGKTWREAKETNQSNVSHVIADKHGGKVLFHGAVTSCSSEDKDGFTQGFVTIEENVDECNRRMTIYFKNENMYGKIDDEIVVTIPEIIVVFQKHTGDLLLNPNYVIGCHVVVVVLPAPPPFLSEKGLDLLGPKYLNLSKPFRSALSVSLEK